MSFFTDIRDTLRNPAKTIAAITPGLKDNNAAKAFARNFDDVVTHPVSSSTGGLIGGTSGVISFAPFSSGAGVNNTSLRGGLSNKNNRYGVIAVGAVTGWNYAGGWSGVKEAGAAVGGFASAVSAFKKDYVDPVADAISNYSNVSNTSPQVGGVVGAISPVQKKPDNVTPAIVLLGIAGALWSVLR